MNTENKDWKPEIGKTAWAMIVGAIREVVVVSHCGQGQNYLEVKSHGCHTNRHKDDLYPTAEAAILGIKVYDLDGNEVVVARDSSEIGLLASEGRILSPFELEFYNFCKKYPNMVAEFAMALLQPKSAIGGESPAGFPTVIQIPIVDPEILLAEKGIYNVGNMPEGFDLSKATGFYQKIGDLHARAMRIWLSDEAGMMNYSWETCLKMAKEAASGGESPTKEDNRDGSYTN